MARNPKPDETIAVDPGPPDDKPSPLDAATLGRAWLEKKVGIEQAEAAFHVAMRAEGYVGRKSFPLDGRRFAPAKNGKVVEV